MDAERQPLLSPVAPGLRQRTFRPLTYEEVLAARHDRYWSLGRCMVLVIFWCLIAACLSMAACLLLISEDCPKMPSVPPTHLSLAPLMAQSRAANEQNVLVQVI